MRIPRLLKKNPHKFYISDYKIIRNEFDYEFYKNENNDLSQVKHDLAFHYLQYGSKEGRRPRPDFDPHYYLKAYGAHVGNEEPFVHYLTKGRKLGYNGTSTEYFYSEKLVYPNNVVPSLRPRNEDDYALASPLPDNLRSYSFRRAAAIVHAFYPELIDAVFERLEKSPCKIDVFVSTDTEEKSKIISEIAKSYSSLAVEVRIIENRGRDVGPMLFGFKDVFDDYEVFLHLHTKRSPHGGDALEPWRDYLYDNLVGSKEIIETNLALLNSDRVGVVFPQHFYELRGILNWGFNFENTSRLLRKAGAYLNKDMVLEFPSGTMFWARTDAFRPILELDLQPEDFDHEAGQVDGTLAHAIERSILFFAETAGYTWAKVLLKRIPYPYPKCVIHVGTLSEKRAALARIHRPLATSAVSGRYALGRAVPETRELLFAPSSNTRPRFVLLVPSVNPRQVFGGISTAIHLFKQIIQSTSDRADFAIVATDAAIEPDGYKSLSDFTPKLLKEGDSGEARILVDAFQRDNGHFQTRSGDIYFATAWWTAGFARDAQKFQQQFFSARRPFIYLIQDFEPDFYGWSSNYALAENTYRNADDYIPIINSEELYRFFLNRNYGIKTAFCLPYEINSRINKMLSPVRREKIIMFYGRPSVKRNAFEILCNGLTIWQTRNPVEAATWRILSVGEEYPESWVAPIQNVTVLGKLSLEQYAYWLNRASIGISLMISPHPSYPPLEMAEAGLMTITNDYEGKTMSNRFDFRSLPYLSPEMLAQYIEDCVAQFQSGEYSVKSGKGVSKILDRGDINMYSTQGLLKNFSL